MFLPIGTDAPIYHPPLATSGLIAANGLAFWETSGGTESTGWILRFGEFAPIEWWKAAFLHFGLAHLVINMVFLWVFGLIIEGKLGWWRFLALYLVLCGADGFVTQLITLAYTGDSIGAGGASGVIYALMAIALVWAPENCIDVLWIWGIGMWGRVARQFDVTVAVFAFYYIATDFLVGWLLLDFEVSTPILHLLGAAVGFPIGVLLLRRGWVDCEGWDLLSILRRRLPEHMASRLLGAPIPGTEPGPDNDAAVLTRTDLDHELGRIRRLLQSSRGEMAWYRYLKLRETHPAARLDEPALRRLIESLQNCGDWPAVTKLLEEYLTEHAERRPDQAARARLQLGAILVKQLHRPRAALRALEPLHPEQLSPRQRGFLVAVERLARRQIESGVIEVQAAAPVKSSRGSGMNAAAVQGPGD